MRCSKYAVATLVLAVGWLPLTAGAQQAAEQPDQGRRRGDSGRSRWGGWGGRGDNSDAQRRDWRGGDRNNDRGGDRGGWRGRGGPPNFTPEQRDQFYNGMVDRYMERLTRTYELDNQQQTQVRSQLEQLKEQQRTYSDQRRQEFEALREQARQRSDALGEGQDRRQAWEGFRDRMRTLMQDAPLMNPERVTGQIEQLLPADQVERGRARREAERQEWEQRREQWRQEREQQRQQEDAQQGQDQGEEPQDEGQAPGMQDGAGPPPGFGDRDSGDRRSRWSRRGGDRRSDRERGDDRQQDQQFEQQGGEHQQAMQVVDPEAQAREERRHREAAINPWQDYVNGFARRYRLDASQQASAQSILREMQSRRVSYEQSRRVDFDMAQRIERPEKRAEEISRLQQPLIDMFTELKSRLEPIPTADQRLAAGERRPSTTQPAIVSTQPAQAAATTQPATGDDSGERRPRADRPRRSRS